MTLKPTAWVALWMLTAACLMATGTIASAAAGRRANTRSGHSTGKAPKFGAIRMKLLGTATSVLLTDGSRWAAYEPVVGTTRLTDTETNQKTDRPDPEGCAGGLKAVGGGELLYECADPECPGQEQSCRFPPHGLQELPSEFESRRYTVADIQGAAQHIVPRTSRVPVGSILADVHFHLQEVGSQWVAGTWESEAPEPHRASGQGVFVNWHTGFTIYEDKKPEGSGEGIEEEPSTSQKEVENLNRVRLMQRLCVPLTRPSDNEENASSHFAPFGYQPPFGVIGPAEAGDGAFATGPAVPLQLRSCHSHRRVVLPTSGIPRFTAPQLGGGVLSWAGSYLTRLRPNRYPWHDLVYRLVGLPRKTSLFLQHAATMAFVTVETDAGSQQIYSARLPWTHVGRS
jgi:hypothetical protein